MSGEANISPAAVAWCRAQREADSALVCLQSGCAQQALVHVISAERLLVMVDPEPPPGEEMAQETVEWNNSLRNRWALQRRLGRLTRTLSHHSARAEASPRTPIDRLDRKGRKLAIIGALIFMLLVALLRPDPGPPEQRAAGAVLPPASVARLVLSSKELQARFPGGAFSHRSAGFRFGEQVEVRLGQAKPMYLLNITLRNAMIHRVTLLHGGVVRHRFLLGPRAIPVGLMEYVVDLRHTHAPRGVDTIVVDGVDGDGAYELGPIRIKDWN